MRPSSGPFQFLRRRKGMRLGDGVPLALTGWKGWSTLLRPTSDERRPHDLCEVNMKLSSREFVGGSSADRPAAEGHGVWGLGNS